MEVLAAMRLSLYQHGLSIRVVLAMSLVFALSLTIAIAGRTVSAAEMESAFRPPAVPLVTCDPYFSIWSAADRLTDVRTTHWTKRPHRLTSLVRIDGKAFRLMGDEPKATPALNQIGLEVLPTRTIYRFEGNGVRVCITFMTPAFPDDLDLMSRPVTFLTWDVTSIDGKQHPVTIYFDNTSEPAVDDPKQSVMWDRREDDQSVTIKFGTQDQAVLGKTGDDRRIDWGYLYTAAIRDTLTAHAIAASTIRDAFLATGTIPNEVDRAMPRASENAPVAAMMFDLGKVGPQVVSRWIVLAYDDQYSIQYFGTNVRPYWARKGKDAQGLLREALRDYPSLKERAAKFDQELMADLRRSGGREVREACRAMLSSVPGRQQDRGGRRRPAASVSQGKHEQWLCWHRRCDLSDGAAYAAVRSSAHQGHACAEP